MFAYLGASLLGVEGQWSAVGMGIAIVFLIPLIRFLMLLPLSRLFKTLKLSTKDLKMMWYTGLSRGKMMLKCRCYRFCLITASEFTLK